MTGSRTPRVAFFGTPPAAVPSLAALAECGEVAFVVTQPDRPRGRSRQPQASAVKEAANDWGLEVLQPDRAEAVADRLEGTSLVVVVAYGQILPATMLTVPVHGFVNVHFSKLPRWRGAAPVQRAIEAGDETTGVTVIQLDAGMDTGEIVAIRDIAIPVGATSGSLTAQLAGAGAALLASCLPDLLTGTARTVPQPESGATVARKVTMDDARLEPRRRPAIELERAVRAFYPSPGAWGLVDGDRVKLLGAAPAPDEGLEPGQLIVSPQGVLMGTIDGALLITEVQPAGKRPMSAAAWARGHRSIKVWE